MNSTVKILNIFGFVRRGPPKAAMVFVWRIPDNIRPAQMVTADCLVRRDKGQGYKHSMTSSKEMNRKRIKCVISAEIRGSHPEIPHSRMATH
jgi:hypothetical protein